MPAKVNPVPEGYRTVTPYLIIRDAARAIEFYVKAFGAKEVMRMPMPDGKLAHAEIQIGDSMIMMADENPEWGARSPQALNGTPVGIFLYVPDVDATLQAGRRRRRNAHHAAQRHVLGRSLRQGQGSVRARVVGGNS